MDSFQFFSVYLSLVSYLYTSEMRGIQSWDVYWRVWGVRILGVEIAILGVECVSLVSCFNRSHGL